MRKENYALKKKQLKKLVARLKELMANGQEGLEERVNHLISRIKRLVRELRYMLGKRELKRILGAAAVLIGIGLSTEAQAQNFASPVANPFGLDSVYQLGFPALADLDNDGDLDLLVGEYYGSKLYFENVGTKSNPSFAAPVVNPFGLDSSYYYLMPEFADLDDDGDYDLLMGGYYGNIMYHENTGTKSAPVFASGVSNTKGMSPVYGMYWPEVADLDDDGDLDLLKGGYNGVFNYQKNNGSKTAANFGANQENPFGLDSTYGFSTPALADLDNDGDLDLLSGSYYGDFYYYKNTGTKSNPSFAAAQINPFGLTVPSGYQYVTSPEFADLDDDGDMDILMTGGYGVFYYYENTSPIGIDENENSVFKVFPNPVSDRLFIEGLEADAKVEIIDLQGRVVKSILYSNQGIDMSGLPAGIFLVKCIDVEGITQIQRVIKE